MWKKSLLAITILACGIASAGPAHAATDAEKCRAAKIKAAGKKVSARANCYAKAALQSESVDPACLQKAEDKFVAAYQKAEDKGGCTTLGDVGSIETKVDTCLADVVGDLACGNGVLDGDEACDDGGLVDGDGCSAICAVESGYVCAGQPSVCAPACLSNGASCAVGSECCSMLCSMGVCAGVTCGDGVIAGMEECDDGNPNDGDGCSSSCVEESGYFCLGQPSICYPGCLNAGDCPTYPNATPVCMIGSCGYVCNAGYSDCNLSSMDGCEINTTSDANNCGGCGVACMMGQICSMGTCTLP